MPRNALNENSPKVRRDWNWLWQGLVSNWLSASLAIVGSLAFAALVRWFGQGVLSNWIFCAVLVLLVGFALAVLKLKRPLWAVSALYGLLASTLVVVILYVAVAWQALLKKPPAITPENVEEHVRKWADTFTLGVRKVSKPDSHFALEISFWHGQPITVARLKELENYIFLRARLTFSGEQKGLLDKLSQDETTRLKSGLALEMARRKIGYRVELPNHVTVSKLLPISDNLTEVGFIDGLDEVALPPNELPARLSKAQRHKSGVQQGLNLTLLALTARGSRTIFASNAAK